MLLQLKLTSSVTENGASIHALHVRKLTLKRIRPLRKTIPLESVSVLGGARGDKGVNMCIFTFRQNGAHSQGALTH